MQYKVKKGSVQLLQIPAWDSEGQILSAAWGFSVTLCSETELALDWVFILSCVGFSLVSIGNKHTRWSWFCIYFPSFFFSPPFFTSWPIVAKFYRPVEVSRVTVLLQMSFFLWILGNLPRGEPCDMVPAVGRALLKACAVRCHGAWDADWQETTSLIPVLR